MLTDQVLNAPESVSEEFLKHELKPGDCVLVAEGKTQGNQFCGIEVLLIIYILVFTIIIFVCRWWMIIFSFFM